MTDWTQHSWVSYIVVFKRRYKGEETLDFWVCALILVRSCQNICDDSDNEAVRGTGRKLQVPMNLLGEMIAVIPDELTHLTHAENEEGLYLWLPSVCNNIRMRFPHLCNRAQECFSLLAITPCLQSPWVPREPHVSTYVRCLQPALLLCALLGLYS